jgi:hypothetical protein
MTLRHSIRLLLVFGALLVGSAQAANVVRPSHSPDTKDARAIEFGMFLGGTATQYDLCVSRGFAPQTRPSAEGLVNRFLQAMEQHTHDAVGVAQARQGWRRMKQEIGEHAADFTRERCAVVIADWKRMLPIVSSALR